MDALRELELLLRPAGGGVYVVSTGLAEQEALQKILYGAATADEVTARWKASLARIATAKVVVLGVPSDVGAGFLRGANMGPQGIRTALLDAMPDWPERAARQGVVDLGDVFVVPQLLHDTMLSDDQKRATRAALYPSLTEREGAQLPLAPLSIAERALDLVFALNPNVRPMILGGDHSNAWPAVAALSRVQKGPWGIVQIDAHTDLLEQRLGVRYCFATWSFHANDLVGRNGRLVQVGIRATRHDRGHWESSLGVRQFWADECLRDPSAAIDAIVDHVKSTGVGGVYFSNDIDGTDEAWADATGTPEPLGLNPDFVAELIRRLGREVGFVGGDVMEVAPPIPRHPGGRERTLATAVRYFRETVDALATGRG
jgi:agmatinase